MKKLILFFSIFSTAVIAASGLFAASGAGTTGAQFLNVGVSARSIAMGNANTGVAFGGVTGANYNPAALFGTVQPEVSFMHYRYILDSQFSYAGYAQPLGKNARAILAGNFIYSSYGAIEETRVKVGQDSGAKTGTSYGSNDTAGSLTFAMILSKKMGVGMNLKYVTQEIAGVRASVPAGDLGLMYNMGPRLSVGAALRNFGPDLKFDRESVPLPFNFTLGISYAILNETLIFTSDFEKPRNQDPSIRAGVELNVGQQFSSARIPRFSFRLGHDGFTEAGSGLSFGTGVRMGNYSVDYAFVPFGLFGEAHRISATVRFGQSKNAREIYSSLGADSKPHSH